MLNVVNAANHTSAGAEKYIIVSGTRNIYLYIFFSLSNGMMNLFSRTAPKIATLSQNTIFGYFSILFNRLNSLSSHIYCPLVAL